MREETTKFIVEFQDEYLRQKLEKIKTKIYDLQFFNINKCNCPSLIYLGKLEKENCKCAEDCKNDCKCTVSTQVIDRYKIIQFFERIQDLF